MARLPRDIQALIDRLEPEMRNAFLEAIDQITSAAQMNRLIAALEAGNVEEAIEALRIEQGFFSPLNEATRGAYLDGGNLVLAGLKLKDPFSGDKFVLGFDGRAVRAERWLRDQSSGSRSSTSKERWPARCCAKSWRPARIRAPRRSRSSGA